MNKRKFNRLVEDFVIMLPIFFGYILGKIDEITIGHWYNWVIVIFGFAIIYALQCVIIENRMKKMKNKRKFKWCIDFLLMGFLFQNFMWLLVLLDGNILNIRWWLLFAIPWVIWGLELAHSNLT